MAKKKKSRLVPGGKVTSIGPYGAVSYSGNYHDESGTGRNRFKAPVSGMYSNSGIVLDKNTEVEHGETSMRLPHRDGGMKDYVYSSYNKLGGVSYADRHKQIMRGGGSKRNKLKQSKLLAKLQENMAGLSGDEVRMRDGGFGSPERVKYAAPHMPRDRYQGATGPNLPKKILFGDDGNVYYIDDNGQYQILDGIDISQYKPTYQTQMESLGQGSMGHPTTGATHSPGGMWYSLPAPAEEVKEEVTPIVKTEKKTTERKKEEPITPIEPKSLQLLPTGDEDPQLITSTGDIDYTAPEINITPGEYIGHYARKGYGKLKKWAKGKDWGGIATDALQFLPAYMAWKSKPDYMQRPDMVPGNRQIRMDRVNYNQERAQNASDFNALSRSIENTGGGPATMINKMAAYGKKQAQDLKIASTEGRANTAISNQEEQMNAQIRAQNSQIAANNRTAMMQVDEFNRAADAATEDRKLNALDTAVKQLGMLRARKLQKEGMTDLAEAISGETGIQERRLIKKSLEGNETFDGLKITDKKKVTAYIYENYDGNVDKYLADVQSGVIPFLPTDEDSSEEEKVKLDVPVTGGELTKGSPYGEDYEGEDWTKGKGTWYTDTDGTRYVQVDNKWYTEGDDGSWNVVKARKEGKVYEYETDAFDLSDLTPIVPGAEKAGNIPFTTKKEGNAFRVWVNENYPDYAEKIDLDDKGSFDNEYIKAAWEKYGGEYKGIEKEDKILSPEGDEYEYKKIGSKYYWRLKGSSDEDWEEAFGSNLKSIKKRFK